MAGNGMNEVFTVSFDDASVITVPIDATLSNSGEAADAKAVGDALDLKANRSELQNAVKVNGQEADAQGLIIVTGEDTAMSATDETTVKAAIEAVDGKTAADIPMSSAAGADSIAEAMESIAGATAETIPMSTGSQVTVAGKIGAVEAVGTANSNAITALQGKTGEDINVTSDEGSETIAEALAASVRTINGEGPDENGNVQVVHAMTADNLTSSASQTNTGEFVKRTSGGAASIHTGDAWLSMIRGNRVHVGYVPESLNMTVNAAPREEGETPITASIDRDTFVAAVSGSTTINLTYTTSWSADPATYGITVTGEPVSGDQITVVYVAEDRGTIIQADPQTFVSTGWNLYNHDVGYAIGLKYATNAQFRISGTYSAVKFSSTISGEKTTITPTDGLFTISANGYIWVEGGNATDTELFMTWTDWVLPEDAPEEFAAYTESVIDISDLMDDHFPYGLMRVADIRDEIDFNTGIATSKVQRISYSAENLATAIASGLAYEYDTDYIYLERATPVEFDMDDYDLDGQYLTDDHGIEYFTGTDIAAYAVMVYGNSLKNKLERDVLTISQQTLTSAQQSQVMDNIGVTEEIAALNSKMAQINRWTFIGSCAGTTVTLSNFNLSDYHELLLVLSAYSQNAEDVAASTICSTYLTNLTTIRARYKTDSNESRDALFNVINKSFTVTSGYTGYLYGRK